MANLAGEAQAEPSERSPLSTATASPRRPPRQRLPHLRPPLITNASAATRGLFTTLSCSWEIVTEEVSGSSLSLLSRCKDANAEKDLVPEIGSLAQVQLAMVRVSFEIFIHDSHQPDFIAREKQKRAKDRSITLKRKAYMQRKTSQELRMLSRSLSVY